MYNEDDAVAKLDAYVISVAGAGRLLGQKTMVRIEKVGRSAAEAELVDPPPASAGSDGDGSERSGRRRGRRGGRGRRKSTADAG